MRDQTRKRTVKRSFDTWYRACWLCCLCLVWLVACKKKVVSTDGGPTDGGEPPIRLLTSAQQKVEQDKAIARVKSAKTKQGFTVEEFFNMNVAQTNSKVKEARHQVARIRWVAACAAEICTVELRFWDGRQNVKASWAVGETIKSLDALAKSLMQRAPRERRSEAYKEPHKDAGATKDQRPPRTRKGRRRKGRRRKGRRR